MEAVPKVHRQRHRRSDSRHSRRHERQPNANSISVETTTESSFRTSSTTGIVAAEEGVCDTASSNSSANQLSEVVAATTTIRLSQENERQSFSEGIESTTLGTTSSQTSSQQTVVLVNGHAPPLDPQDSEVPTGSATASLADDTADTPPFCNKADNSVEEEESSALPIAPPLQIESPTQPLAATGGGGSSRNSSGDALSLRETLQQLPATLVGTHHRHRRTHSPQPTATATTHEPDASFHRGILGFMDRELKQCSPTPSALSVGGATGSGGSGSGTARKLQTLSDPQASPAQRSIRSRSSLEKSPRRKRSKSESRRRRERKLIAAGEMEVRQANETLMRYLKQCSEMNDASLSGELEIDQNFDERRVHRKTKSQRDKRGHLICKLYTAGGLSSILKELSDDIVPAEGEEIYNPFTPVVSPTEEDTPAHIDKMFLQTSSGYRPVEHGYYKHSFVGAHGVGGGVGRGGASGSGCGAGGGGGGGAAGVGMRMSGSYGETRCLLDAECRRHEISTNIQLACIIQRIWLLISNICHGLLAGLALAHLLFVLSSHPVDWSRIVNQISLAGKTSQTTKDSIEGVLSAELDGGIEDGSSRPPSLESSQTAASAAVAVAALGIGDYAAFAEIYLNTFYCLVIVCLVSVFDRMDICRWDLSNASELISFRWLIIAMIYIATIILTICSDSIDERLYYNNNANVTLTQKELLSNSVLSVWSSLSVTRSIGAICGWIMIGLTPHEDLLYEHLVDLTKYQMTNN